MSSKTTIAFLLVHGAWHDSTTWSKVVPLLEARLPGAISVVVDLPSSGAVPGIDSCEPDYVVVHDAAKKLVEEGKNVVIVMHSYGGLVGTNGSQGLSRQELSRGRKTVEGAVVGMVYISAYVRSLGQGLIEEGMAFRQIGVVDSELKTISMPADDAREAFYHDLSEEEIAHHISKLKPQSLATSFGEGRYEPWNHGVPCLFVLTANDGSIPPLYQEKMAARGKMDVVRVEAAHTVMLSQPEATADAIIDFARKIQI